MPEYFGEYTCWYLYLKQISSIMWGCATVPHVCNHCPVQPFFCLVTHHK